MKNITISESLRELIEDKGLCADTVGRQIGVSGSIVAQWIRENTPIKLFNLLKLAEFFECSVDFLCGRTDVRGSYNHAEPTFPKQLKILLKRSNESNKKIFEEIGMNSHAVYDWERGSVPLSTSLIAIADYFDVTVDYLLGI